MNYSFMTFSCPELDWEGVVAAARRFGYDGVEPRAQARHAHGVELEASAQARRAIRNAAEQAGVAVCCLATSCRYTATEPAERQEMLETTRRLIRLARDIGAPAVRVFGGAIPDGMSRQEAIGQVAECLAQLGPDAQEAGVTLCVETHDSWCDARHLAQLLQRVDHPSVQANWDLMHPVRAGMTIDEAWAALRPHVRHCHFHDGTHDDAGGLCPVGQGQVDHRRAVELLAADGYRGFLSGEWIHWEPWEQHLPRELATMRSYEP
ncbi:MAG: sugar phosphate isomerase/epimerase family protein [Candidatus Brocadiia bacterium]